MIHSNRYDLNFDLSSFLLNRTDGEKFNDKAKTMKISELNYLRDSLKAVAIPILIFLCFIICFLPTEILIIGRSIIAFAIASIIMGVKVIFWFSLAIKG